MKKLFTLFLAIVASIGISYGYQVTYNNMTFDMYNGQGISTFYGLLKFANGDTVNIPRYFYKNNAGYYVTGISSDAFTNNKIVKYISFSTFSSNWSCSTNIFKDCVNLQWIEVKDNPNLVSVNGVLYNADTTVLICYPAGREEVTFSIPMSVKTIGSYAFSNAINLEQINLHQGIENIEQYAFTNTGISELIELPNAETIPDGLFSSCQNIKQITIPENIKNIGSSAFEGCSNLTNIVLSANLEYIGNTVFASCKNIELITCLGKEPAIVGDYTFPAKPIYVPCNSIDAYKTKWSAYASTIQYAPLLYSVEGKVNKTNAGRVKVPENVCETQIVAIPNYGYHFVKWSDGEIANPRTLQLTSDTSFTALFDIDREGKCGNNMNLTWVYDPNTKTLKISGDGALNQNVQFGLEAEYELQKLIIEGDITSIGQSAFRFPNLTSIEWNVKRCADFTYNNTPFYVNIYKKGSSLNYDLRSQITSVLFANDVEYIPAYLCSGMNKVPEIMIQNCKTEVGPNALSGCKYRKEGAYDIILQDTTICYGSDFYLDGEKFEWKEWNLYEPDWTRYYKTVEGCDSTITIKVNYVRLLYSELSHKDVIDYPNTGSIEIRSGDGTYDYYTLNGERNADLTNLSAGEYQVTFVNKICDDSVTQVVTIAECGMYVNNQYYLLDKTNHKAILTFRGSYYGSYSNEYSGNITIPETITFQGEEYQVVGINGAAFRECTNIQSVTFANKTPLEMYGDCGLTNNTIVYVPFGSMNAYKEAPYWKDYNLHVINPKHVAGTSGATSATITFGNEEDAVHIASCGMVESDTTAGNILEYIGLEPNSEYKDIPFFIITEEGDYDTLHYSFKTPALELTTKPSQPVSGTTALLFAETNMSDAETNCGFEYKRNDAPADMDGTKVFCPVASGTMAGRLKNLKDDVYYKYRAFYQSASGQMYYGDWQYIFTGDVTVEFDPVLYTYSATVVKETEATISGYALAGAADFTEQGFEYWAESRAEIQGSKGAMKRMPAALGEHFFVQASGINMRVTLTNLDPGTVYKYRAYGKVGDQVYYGAEQTFTTRGTYVAPSYLITFLNWDGTELQKSQVATGTIPEYTGVTPVRPDDDQFTYVFKGWTPELVEVTEDAVYTAEFIAEAATAIDDVQGDKVQGTKVIENGVLYLIFNGTKYNVQGQVVK